MLDSLLNIRFDGIEKPFTLQSQDWIVLLFIFQFFVYAYFFIRYPKQLIESVRTLFQFKERSSIFMESSQNYSKTNVFAICFCVINVALFLYLFMTRGMLYYEDRSIIILLFMGAVGLFFILRVVILSFLGFVFLDKKQALNSFKNSFYLLMSILGIVLYPCILLLIYSPFYGQISLFIIGFAACLSFVVLTAYILIKHFFTHFYSFFYLILYLCTLEILPAVLLYVSLVKIEQTIIVF